MIQVAMTRERSTKHTPPGELPSPAEGERQCERVWLRACPVRRRAIARSLSCLNVCWKNGAVGLSRAAA